MKRSIEVSTEVFSGIWAQRRAGEESEDEILRRLLGCQKGTNSAPAALPNGTGAGVRDMRNSVHFPEGFEIFRTYKGASYSARAVGGAWLRTDNGKAYQTLNQLNGSIAAGAENVWNGNWKYRRSDGSVASIATLRT